jgi:hypothetical protein
MEEEVMRRISIVVLVGLLAGAVPLRAQEFVPSLPIKSRATIFVVDDKGVEHRGRFLRADDVDLIMLVNDNEQLFKRDSILWIDRQGDSLKNGAIIGALVGTPFAVLGFIASGNYGALLAPIGGYMAIGMGLDALHQGRTPVYSGVAKTTAHTSDGRGTSVQFTLRW